MKTVNKIALIGLFFIAFGCSKDDGATKDNSRTFGIFNVKSDDVTVDMNGDITSNTPSNFNKLLAKYPNIKTINMLICPGSRDDGVNLKVSKLMHDKGIGFHLFSNSEI